MAKKKGSQVDPGDKGGQGGSGDGDDDPSKDGNLDDGSLGDDVKKKKDSDDDGTKFVTPTALQGVIDAHKRTTSAELKKSGAKIDSLQTSIDEIKTLIAGKKDGDGKTGDDDSPSGKKVDPEIAELRRRLEQTEKALQTEKASRATAEQKEEDFRFENTVKQALTSAKCEKPDAAFLVIKPLLKKKDDGTPFATVTLEGGLETDVDLDTYIKRYFSEEVLPHVFKGKMRTGSPASGESGESGSGQGYDYTWEQVKDPEFYAANLEKVRKAIESGRVKGMPREGAGAL